MKDLHARTPVDQVARRVISEGVAWALNMKPGTYLLSETPLPTRPVPVTTGIDKDLTGTRVGRLVVTGLHRDINRRWVLRCDCGWFTTRSAKAIKNPGNSSDMCERCRRLDYVQREEKIRRELNGSKIPAAVVDAARKLSPHAHRDSDLETLLDWFWKIMRNSKEDESHSIPE